MDREDVSSTVERTQKWVKLGVETGDPHIEIKALKYINSHCKLLRHRTEVRFHLNVP